MDMFNETPNVTPHKNKVHNILAHSYSVYFLLFLIGVCLDLVFKIKIFPNSSMITAIGIIFLLLGSLLALWAQMSTHDLKKDSLTKESFSNGPYSYVRHPTHWGLFLVLLGFGIMVNAFFVILTTVISFFIARFVFLRKQETVLAEKYGAPYIEYQKSVRF